MSQVITKETISRLIADIKNIVQNPLTDHGIYYKHDEEDMLKGYALIVGSEGTPYFGGYYFFEFNFPHNYPFSPPTLTYCTNNGIIRFNPNLYTSGKVCVSILNTWRGEQWTSCQTISTVLLSLSSLLSTDPLLNEPGFYKGNPDINKYTSIIEYANIDVAVCDVISKRYSNLTRFNIFDTFVHEHFARNFDKLMAFVDSKIQEIPSATVVTVSVYNLRTQLNYAFLKSKLIACKV